MKRWIKVLFWILGGMVLILAGFFSMLLWSMRPTTGSRIASYANPRSALILVDIQEDYTGPDAKRRFKDGDRLVLASNALTQKAQAEGMLVIHIQNVIRNPILCAAMGGVNAEGAPGTEMDRRLLRVPGLKTFTKERSDAFSNPELDAYLRQQQVNQVMLAGLDAAYCVNATARGALNRGYQVVIYQDAIATESGKNLQDLAQSWTKAGAQIKVGMEK